MKYMLERAEMYIVPEAMTKNRTCQSTRWKQVAMSDNLNALIEYMGLNQRIVDDNLKVVKSS